jgi:hypothetical protein
VRAAAALPVASASANYYLDQHQADYARDYLHDKVGYHHTAASCRPQYRKRAEPGYIYHRWACAFAAGDTRYSPSCRGMITIAGSSDAGSYYPRVNFAQGACPYGTSG